MKKLVFTFAVFGLLFATSCKKETTKETTIESDPMGTTVTTETTTTESNYDPRMESAELKLKNAERELQAAKDAGDLKAQEAAQKVADDAKMAWERTKASIENAGQKTQDAVDKAAEKGKDNYNKTLEKAKIK